MAQILEEKSVMATHSLANYNMHAAMIFKDDVEQYMLPFNLISEKKSKVLVEEDLSFLTKKQYQNEPFLQTYWNEIEKDEIIVSWLPYFSQCTYKTSHRIFLSDLIDPLTDDEICYEDTSILMGSTLKCRQKLITTTCMLEELNVVGETNVKEYWWQNSFKPPYYFFRQLI